MNELKNCPFCGSVFIHTAIIPVKTSRTHYAYDNKTICSSCGSSALITRWNTRPIEDALKKEHEITKFFLWKTMRYVENDAEGTYVVKSVLRYLNGWTPVPDDIKRLSDLMNANQLVPIEEPK